MTNEEAFEKWYSSHGDGASYYRDKLVWQAAIAYMQEQSEPYAYTDGLGSLYFDGNPDGDIPLYTTAQRQQPLKRLSDEQVEALYDGGSWHDFANAIMDAMQELNK